MSRPAEASGPRNSRPHPARSGRFHRALRLLPDLLLRPPKSLRRLLAPVASRPKSLYLLPPNRLLAPQIAPRHREQAIQANHGTGTVASGPCSSPWWSGCCAPRHPFDVSTRSSADRGVAVVPPIRACSADLLVRRTAGRRRYLSILWRLLVLLLPGARLIDCVFAGIDNHTDVTGMQPSRVTDFGAFAQSAGFRIEDLANLNTNSLFNLKASIHTNNGDPLQFGSYGKPISSLHTNTTAAATVAARIDPSSLAQQTGAQPNLVASTTGNIENWGESAMAAASPMTDTSTDPDTDEGNQMFEQGQLAGPTASDSSDKSRDKLDQKTLRRLAQNREAARKSRLRKKAYIQNLESSRLKLNQLEQELQRARQQGIFISSSGDQPQSTSGNGALAFDMEYARWLEEHNKYINELRAAVNAHAGDNDLRSIVDKIMSHYDEIFKLKGVAAKADVFHVLSGMWKTPAERCFMWLGGFRSSELLKLLAGQLEPLTDQQLVGISNLQQSSQQAEDALSQGMEALQQSLAETLASGSLGPAGSSGNVANYMGQMAMAMGKLGTLENFLRQADNLRLQTLQQMQRILTTRQSARALLAISDYFSRLRALSSLWLARPRE